MATSNFIDLNTDLYNTTLQCGIYMINGLPTLVSPGEIYPVMCSFRACSELGLPVALDDAYIVYPGFGFMLYAAEDYSTSAVRSDYFFNTSNQPCIFQLSPNTWTGGRNVTTSGSSGITAYIRNQTRSMKVYYRNKEITTAGISS